MHESAGQRAAAPHLAFRLCSDTRSELAPGLRSGLIQAVLLNLLLIQTTEGGRSGGGSGGVGSAEPCSLVLGLHAGTMAAEPRLRSTLWLLLK